MSGKDTKLNIYNSAKTLFCEKGYLATTVADIINLSKTNKGCFYHHFESKYDIGLQIYLEMRSDSFNLEELFPEENPLVHFSLGIMLGWYSYFNSLSNRKFMSEFFSEKAISGREEVYRVCQKYSDKHFSEKELQLIKLADTGLTTQLFRSLMDQIDHYNYEEISIFYLCTLFEMLKINKGIIEKTFQRASVLFKSLNIKLDGLYVSLEK